MNKQEWKEAVADMLDAMPLGALCTVNDVREMLPLPDDADPRIMGSVFKRAAWVPAGHVKNDRTQCHKRPIQQFRKDAQ